MNSGIYEIMNLATGKRYVGSTVDFYARWRGHRSRLRRGIHHSQYFQQAWDKYGEDEFKFRVILTCQPSMLLRYEQQILDKVVPEYNVNKIAGSSAGRSHTVETREKIRKTLLGRPISPEQLALRFGRIPSDATREKMRRAGLDRQYTSDQIEQARALCKANAIRNLGRKLGSQSAIVRKNASLAHLGKKLSLAHCAAISRSQKIRWGRR